MTFLEALKQANKIHGIKGMEFTRSIEEFNALKEKLNFLDYPRNIIAPWIIEGTIQTGRTSEIFIVTGFMMTRLNQDTDDFRSLTIEPDYIEPMRQAARTFMKQLVFTELTDSQVQNISYRIAPEYRWTDTHLFGVNYTLRWPVNGKLCV